MARKKKVKKQIKKSVNQSVLKEKKHLTYGWMFANILLVIIFIYGLYRIYYKSWSEGLSIIVADLVIILIIKLVLKLRRR
jgi:hypothetical protein